MISDEEGTAEIRVMMASDARSARPARWVNLARAALPVLIRALLVVI